MFMKLLQAPKAIGGYVPALSVKRSYGRPVANRNWMNVIGVWIERSRQRRALANLDDRLLDDVGIMRSEATREIAKPFWR